MYTREELIRVAKMYYELGLTQKEISERLKYSRPTISRMLDTAMEVGVVQVKIEYPLNSLHELEEDIKNKYKLKKVFVVPAYVDDEELMKEDVGKAVANYLNTILGSGDTLGVSWGTTLGAVTKHLKSHSLDGMRIVQLNGGVAKNAYSTGSVALLERFSDAFGAEFHLLSVPSIVDSEEIASAIVSDSSIKEVLSLGKQANVALFGIGKTSYESVLFKGGYFKGDSYEELIAKGAVGDICSRYFNIEGQLVDPELNKRTIGLQLEDLTKREHSIAVAVGVGKVKAVLGALRGGFMNTLFIDENLAKNVLHEEEMRDGSSQIV